MPVRAPVDWQYRRIHEIEALSEVRSGTAFPSSDSRPENSPEAPLLVLVHIRKTAGTTVSYVMHRQFDRGEVIDINAPTVEAANRNWNAMRPEHRSRIRCVRGHLPYRPDLFAPRATTFFTMLRDPVERVISEYYFNLHNAGEKFHTALSRGRVTLDHFVNSELSAEVHNAQTRMLAGAKSAANPAELLELAGANLRERMAVVGISERLDETLLLCRAILGWRSIIYRPINVNRRRPTLDRIAPATVTAIERANARDRSLYDLGCARMDELIRQHRISQSEVVALRRAARIYGGARRAIGFPRELWIEARMAMARRRVARGF
jgi:hypothetical protein